MDNIEGILEQLKQYHPDDKCTVPIEKWALIRADDVDGRLVDPFVVERLSLIADNEAHLNLAAHYEHSGFTVIYRGALSNLARLIARYPNEIGSLCDLRKR